MSSTTTDAGASGARKGSERIVDALDRATLLHLIDAATDVALLLDEGVIREVMLGAKGPAGEDYEAAWLGRPWVDTVTVESRPKVEELIAHAAEPDPRWREINHPTEAGTDLAIRYSAMAIGEGGRVLALGRDMSDLSQLQQRLVQAHQELERDYARLSEAETRYRLLFESVTEPVLIVDPGARRIEEANPAAAQLLSRTREELVGLPLEEVFSARSRSRLDRAFSDAISSGRAAASELQTTGDVATDLALSAFRMDQGTRMIARLDTGHAVVTDPATAPTPWLRTIEELPDGLVITGDDLQILAVNRAFTGMTQLMHGQQAVGTHLGDHLGRSTTDLNLLVANLKNHGVVRNFATALRDRTGNAVDVEVSAVAADHQGASIYGLCIRRLAHRGANDGTARVSLPNSNEEIAELVGRVQMREIVRESTEFIEKLCIEAALEITHNNRASAAEMLGLSRQGLYSKLKRYGLDR